MVAAAETTVAAEASALGSAMLDIAGLNVSYPVYEEEPVRAVRDLDLSVRPGEIVGLVGESGSGKTTLARAVMGLLTQPGRIDGGSIRFDGKDMRALSENQLRAIRGRDIAMVIPNPRSELDPLIALCMEPAQVSIHCVRDSKIRYGDRVAVIGLGALGLLAVSIAKAAGAETLIAVDFLPQRRAMARQYGADHTLDPSDGDVALAIRDLTGDMGVDVCIELTGVYPGLSTAISSVRFNGTICSAGFYQGEAHDLFLGREWHMNNLTMIVPNGCGGWHETRGYPHWNNRRVGDTILSMMRQDRLKAQGLINRVYESLDDATGVFQHIIEDPNALIKFAVDLRD